MGKTYQMLSEARQLARQGVDVAIGYFEPHGRKDTIAQTEGLETIPRRMVEYRGASFEEMDTDAILQRHPRVCLVDELAHTNVPGSEREKRWQDAGVLLDAGIDVHATVNVQHLESLNDCVRQATGVVVRETVPDWVLDEAGEVVLVDLTPRALRNRLERGVVYAPEKASQAMANFFNERNLNFLREMALRHTAHEVEDRLDTAPPADARPHPHLPHRQPHQRGAHPPWQARGRLSARRVPGRARAAADGAGAHAGAKEARDRAPPQLRARPAHRRAHH